MYISCMKKVLPVNCAPPAVGDQCIFPIMQHNATVHAPLVFCHAQCQKVEAPLMTVKFLEWELSLVSFIPVCTTLTPTIAI